MNSKQLSELSATVEAQRIHPQATVFRHIPVGGKFRFVVGYPSTPGQYGFSLVLTKTAPGWYYNLSGRKFRASALSAVLPVE